MSYEDEEARDYYFERKERYREMFAGDNVDERSLGSAARKDVKAFSRGDHAAPSQSPTPALPNKSI